MTLTKESVLALVSERPVRFQELAQSKSANCDRRRRARAIIDELVAERAIRMQYLDGVPCYVLADWQPGTAYWRLQIDSLSRRTPEGCVEWVGAFSTHGKPVFRDGSRIMRPVRKWLWENYRGGDVRKADIVYPSCGNESCIELSHLVKKNQGVLHKGKRRTVATKLKLSIVGQRKLTREDASAIRSSNEDSLTLAKRFGVSRETINSVKRNQTHKEFSMFTALLAA